MCNGTGNASVLNNFFVLVFPNTNAYCILFIISICTKCELGMVLTSSPSLVFEFNIERVIIIVMTKRMFLFYLFISSFLSFFLCY